MAVLAARPSPLAAQAPAKLPRESSAWLNVVECGASGSNFQTSATTTAGSKDITVANVGDLRVGQGVMVSRCNVHYTPITLTGAGDWSTGIFGKPLGGSVEIRGYDGSAGSSWVVYLLDIKPSSSPAFRWSDDHGRTWHGEVPITHAWQPLQHGIEVRLNQRDWEKGYAISFGVRDQLVARITKIEGNTLTLTRGANRSVKDAVVRHCDDDAIQAAVDRAIKERRHVWFPVGHYRLSHGIRINRAAAIVLEGQNAADTLLDISDGEGSCFSLHGGMEVTIRNFRMIGFMGFDERDKAGAIWLRGTPYVWGLCLKGCSAAWIIGTERVLIENCHASRMSSECFASDAGAPSRATVKPGGTYSKAITYLRCSVTDCARNAFNDGNCGPENTSVQYCRIQDVGGCTWEGASRFVRFVGNYVRNAGPVAIGNLGPVNRDRSFDDLGSGQHVVADNVFEGNVSYATCAIRSSMGSTQVVIRNNLFINFGSSAVEASGETIPHHFPSANTTITGNILDMTCVGRKSTARTAISVSANDTIVSDNQIYVRGSCDPLVKAIRLWEPALNVNVHDNLIRNCGVGLQVDRREGRVTGVIDGRTCLLGGLPLEPRYPQVYCGWGLAWLSGSQPKAVSIIDALDPATLRFTLREPRPMKAGDRFQVVPCPLNWNLHDNTITGCLRPVVLDGCGSETSLVRNNLISRGEATGVSAAVDIRGRFRIVGNQISGFDEKDAQAVVYRRDPWGQIPRLECRDNVIDRCTKAISEDPR
jgi:hypothetical protein